MSDNIPTIIDYRQSPTGKAFIGLAKAPLMKNKKHGFQGVLLQSEDRSKVECSECGDWMKQITNSHLSAHGLNASSYKKKYGLNIMTGLVSDVTKEKRFYKAIQNTNGLRNLRPNYQARYAKEKKNDQMEFKNLRGTCPEQLKSKLVDYIKRFHRLPTNGTKSFPISTYSLKFGSWSSALKNYGLPHRVKGTGGITPIKFLFPDGESYSIPNHEPNGYEMVYQVMLKKCKILK